MLKCSEPQVRAVKRNIRAILESTVCKLICLSSVYLLSYVKVHGLYQNFQFFENFETKISAVIPTKVSPKRFDQKMKVFLCRDIDLLFGFNWNLKKTFLIELALRKLSSVKLASL